MQSRFKSWPNGKKIAIAITPMFEVWPEGKGPANLVQRTLVHIPHSDYTDNRVVWLSPRQYYDVYKDTFDYLYANEPMALMVMTVHSHFGGRPLMAAVFDKLLTYFAQFPDVWFARHRELAQWALDSGSDEVTYAQRFFG